MRIFLRGGMHVGVVRMRVVSRVHFRIFQLLHHFGLRRPGDFALEFILGFGELPHGLTHAAGEFRKLLRAEKKQDDQQDDNEIRPCQIKETGDIHSVGVVIQLHRYGKLQWGIQVSVGMAVC